MYLKSITLKGFKSFPERTRLEFGPGTSVIVGPNGSGKSNVTDAVLWALGEQSPVAIRGQSMQDVIFAGVPGRQAAESASVELVLDDSEQTLGLGPEVSIVRRLDRSGDSEYRLAGARCRLIDVLELLSDTGMGKEMHSVISQGQVESIVTSKPRERRVLIEEAAGLGKHRKRRHRAQLKLAHTQENLDRALDVEREARSRLRPLKRQAEAAELHARLHRQMQEIRWQLARDELRARLLELSSAREQADQAKAARRRLEQELERVAARRRAAEEALAERSSEREELSRRSFAAQAAADRVGYRLDAVRAASGTVEARLQQARASLHTLRAQAAADAPDADGLERVAALESELEALERDREVELGRQLAELEGQRAAAAATEQRCGAELEQAAAARQQAESEHERARNAVREAERELEAARRESARIGGELAAVNQFLRAHQSAPGGSRSLADALAVAPGYELAVAAALDGRLGAALVDDRESANRVLERAGGEGGRVLLATREETHPEAPSTESPIAGAERLADHVAGEHAAAALARRLLADVWVVDELESVPDDFSGLAVTRRGRVFSPALRELRQAASVGEERVLAERNRRDQLVAATERTVQAEQATRQALDQRMREAAELDAARDAAVVAHRQAVHRRDEAAEEQRRLAVAIDRRRAAPDEGPAAARRAQVAAELSGLRASLQRAERDRTQRDQQIERLQTLSAKDAELGPLIAGLIEELQQLAEAIAVRRGEFAEALTADRQAGEHLAAELRDCAQQEAAVQTRLLAAGESLTSLQVRAERAQDQATEVGAGLTQLASELQLEDEPAETPLESSERDELGARLERLIRRREQLGPVNPLADQEYAEAIAHVEELERQRADLETALRELHKLIRDTDHQIQETFEQTFAAAARNFEELVAQLFPGGSGRLRLTREREGQEPVLGGAAEGGGQQRATGGLHLAEGGDGDGDADGPLQQEDTDLLGVEIEITPSGKATRQLMLLSGGEKSMTALAFLFAVFLARPCPFYILDEVEAALDDLNIDRFLELLEHNASRAQFIVVTHQKRTMDAADMLYGVAMGDDGISKVVSRRLPARQAA